ncbi:MAG: aspartate-semialdehyde dehydrogenase [Gemmatimonadaceae bacterium]
MTAAHTIAPARRIPVGVLGATGAVGQTFIRLLANHPWFVVAAVAASERSAGKKYRDAAHWLGGEMPESVANLTVTACDPSAVDAPIVFSALDSDVAGEVEASFARAGRLVLSNARHYRMDADVPLLIPEVNPDHLGLIPIQRAARGWTGAIVTNSNCSTMVIALALAPLHQAFGVTELFVTTLQALSGAGYPGVPSLDILGNTIPFIGGGEEEKIESEPLKILGTFEQNAITPARMHVSAQVNRVAVEHGHTACMSVKLGSRATPEAAIDAFRSWKGAIAEMRLPSAPVDPVIVTMEPDRPQPRRDVNAGNGMSVVVGRVRTDPMLDLRLVAMGHNTIRGAAGASVLNAELMFARGFIKA